MQGRLRLMRRSCWTRPAWPLAATLVATAGLAATASGATGPPVGGAAAAALNPCMLVTSAEAHTIVREALISVKEAPLGPTCIYTFKGKLASVTIAIETLNYVKAVSALRKPKRVKVAHSHASAYCGTLGTPVLIASLGHGQTLNVTAPCRVATGFAVKALKRLHK